MKLVILESPYAANDRHTVEDHVRYARACVRDSLGRGEAPIASHLLYTQPGILDDLIPEERAWGIEAGLAWRSRADLHVFYTDMGISRGMQFALAKAEEHKALLGRPFELRTINWQP